jgi:flagellar motor switch protein FliN/FliY
MSDDNSPDDMTAEWAAALESQDKTEKVKGAVPPKGAESGGDALAAEWAAALASDEQAGVKKAKEQASLTSKAKEVNFKDLTDEAKVPHGESDRRDLDFILDIPLDVSAELGRTRLLINELLQLGQGSVVELNKLAGEPLEVYVNGKLVARGEAVVINEKFGVRLTDIISPIERVKQLG